MISVSISSVFICIHWHSKRNNTNANTITNTITNINASTETVIC